MYFAPLDERRKLNCAVKYDTIASNKWLLIVFDLILFAFSIINSSTLVIWLIITPLVLFLFEGKKGLVLFFAELQFRSLFSSGIAPQFVGFASVAKWAVVFVLSGAILLLYAQTIKHNVKIALVFIAVFVFYCIGASLLTSSYPVVAMFKVISYFIPFSAILIGVSSEPSFKWLKTIIYPLGALLIISLLFIRSSVGYLRNGSSFQGIFNHPNVFGSLIAMFACGLLCIPTLRSNITKLIFILGSICLVFLTGSRTSLITIIVCSLIALIVSNAGKTKKMVLLVSLIVLCAAVLLIKRDFLDTITSFLFKGHVDSFFYSRTNQIQSNIERFIQHPFLGTGFNVPYDSRVRSFSFSFDLVTENGNLILALLGDTGIIGLFLFVLSYGHILISGKKTYVPLFLSTILISFGEMTFFSTNNFGILMYFYIALYFSMGTKKYLND